MKPQTAFLLPHLSASVDSPEYPFQKNARFVTLLFEEYSKDANGAVLWFRSVCGSGSTYKLV